ncbi:MAG TPA: MFS transporter [Solirubrobacteraceae bacterium]|nr:MFS transporter [Solirubrobacteraceae bacterium]
MLSLLKTPSLRRFFLAHLQSELGTGAAYVALLMVAYERLHSGWAISLVLLADFVPGIALGATLGALADRLPRRRLMIGADLLRAGAFVGLAVIPWFGATVALALLAGIGSTMYRTTVNAALPGMVREVERSPATALYGMNCSIGMTVGPALTALVLLLAPATVVLAANGVTFLVSAAVLRTLRIDHDVAWPAQSNPASDRTSVWSSTIEGVQAARRIPGVSVLLLIGATSVLAGALMNVAEPLLATGPLHAGSSGFSVLVAVYGASMAVTSAATARAGSRVNRLRRWLLIGIAVQGAGMIGSAAAPSLSFATVSFALTGAGNGLLAGPEIRLLQELASERLLGRVFGLRDALINSAYVLAFVSAGAVLAALGVRAIFALGGVGLLALTTTAWLGLRPRRSADALPALAETA